jgi:hypothetical protein
MREGPYKKERNTKRPQEWVHKQRNEICPNPIEPNKKWSKLT